MIKFKVGDIARGRLHGQDEETYTLIEKITLDALTGGLHVYDVLFIGTSERWAYETGSFDKICERAA